MSLFEIADRRSPDERPPDCVPDFPLYRQSTSPTASGPSAQKTCDNPADDPDVIRAWGGQRVQCVALSATAVVILALLVPINESFIPEILKTADDLWFDKLVHMSLFAVLTGLYCCVFLPFCRTAVRTFEYLTRWRFFLIVASITLLAVVTEFLQPLFGRTFDYLDMAVDILAIIPGFGVFIVFNDVRQKLVSRRTN
ncbi:MAG: hypothetical protein NXI04_15200 [Planctomycetaceae bacterium]|nr:hypothetical protein [Planctomycetaceae bacterium]